MSSIVEREAAGPSLEADASGEPSYRPMSVLAVVSCVLGVMSCVALLDWLLALVPLAGLLIGLVAYRRVRANRSELTGEGLALAGICFSGAFLIGGLTLNATIYAMEVPFDAHRISYDDLQPDPANPREVIPRSALELDGTRVFIKGYMLPGSQTSGIRKFVLVRDSGDCCFGGNPKLTDMIDVSLKDELVAEYASGVRKVAGTFRVDVSGYRGERGKAVYFLEADHLR